MSCPSFSRQRSLCIKAAGCVFATHARGDCGSHDIHHREVHSRPFSSESSSKTRGIAIEFDGRGAAKWYYMDVEEMPPGVLTWQNLRAAFEGLLLCVFNRHQYHAILFEIWERTESGDREIQIGTGEFGTKVQATEQ